MKRNVPIIGFASLAMVAVLVTASQILAPYLASGSGFLAKASALAIEIGVGLAVLLGFDPGDGCRDVGPAWWVDARPTLIASLRSCLISPGTR